MVQYSYSLYTAAVTGDSDSSSEENGPTPTKERKGDLLLNIHMYSHYPPPVTSDPLSGQQTPSTGNEQLLPSMIMLYMPYLLTITYVLYMFMTCSYSNLYALR